MNELTKSTPQRLDGFRGYTDESDGQRGYVGGGAPIVRFTNQAEWLLNGVPLPDGREYVVTDVGREVVKWPPGDIKGGPVDRIVLAPHQRFPDIEKLNDETPRDEWRTDLNGNLVGPYQAQHVLKLLDIVTNERLIFPTATIGGSIAVRNLVQCTNDRRDICGVSNLVPVVTLADVAMTTAYGVRRRPHFNIVRFIAFGSGGEETPTISHESTRTAEMPPAKDTVKDSIPF
jgi:hypothetical protein